MDHHSYSLGTEIRKQGSGGPIGLKLSGAIAKVFMVSWCRSFREAVIAAIRNIVGFLFYLHLFYVDYHNLAMEELPPGARYLEGKVVVVPKEVERDLQLPGDHRAALIMKDIANSVCKFTSFKTDIPAVAGCPY